MTTGDELLLIAIVVRRRHIRIRATDRLRFALRAAELADLGLAGRIVVGPRLIEVTDPRPVEDRHLNNVLRSLGAAHPQPGLKDWLRRTPRSLTFEYLSRLEDRKTVRVRRWRDAGGRSRHDIVFVDLSRRQELLDRLDRAVSAGTAGQPDARDLTLAALIRAADLTPAVYPGLRGIAGRRRLAALAAAGHLAPATGDGRGADEELAAALAAGAGSLTRQLQSELGDLYADFTTGGHGLGHSADPGSWSEGGAGGTGHAEGGGHGGW
ncbi:GPP34 family phosphoprotein [Streptomyces sp. NPDC050421]|uniref:GOLPH3/VPS74 family protein n=1 Tax=unclassified Streptomyces TaxID=2593676 RepID=UPI0037A7C288